MSRGDSGGRFVIFALVGLCAISLRLAWGLSGEFPVNAGTEALAQQGGGCGTVFEVEGSGDRESEPFEVLGESFRVEFEADNPGENSGYAFFNVIDENGGVVEPESQDLDQDDPARIEGSATFSSGPGSYTIEVVSRSADYAITVEECGGDDGGGEKVRSTSQPPSSIPRTGASQDNRADQIRSLLQAGGPEDGPVPAIPGGGCPEEYPVPEGDVCYPHPT